MTTPEQEQVVKTGDEEKKEKEKEQKKTKEKDEEQEVVKEPPARRRKSSVLFVLSGSCSDVERLWARLPPLVLEPGGTAYPRVYCLGLGRMFLPEALVQAVFRFPDAERAGEDMRGAARYPEVLLLPATARDAPTLRALGAAAPGSTAADDVLLMTVRGAVAAVREARERQAALSPGWAATLPAAWRTLAAVQRHFQGEARPREPEDAYTVQARPALPPAVLAPLPAGTDAADVVPQLRPRRRRARARTPTAALAAQARALRAQLQVLRRAEAELRADVIQMRAILAKGNSS